jgi:hypothetical protein
LKPIKEALAETSKAVQNKDAEMEELVRITMSGGARGALLEELIKKADTLHLERERLRAEQRRLTEALTPLLGEHFDALGFKRLLREFVTLSEQVEPQELHQLLRLMVRKIEWMPEGLHWIEFQHMPKSRLGRGLPGRDLDAWFATTRWTDGPDRIRTREE